ncbi:MAG: PEP-CTERM sorting domain-containing protein [Terrimicrobiaceae bacterium]
MKKHLLKSTLLGACLAALVNIPANAAVVTIGYWRGGENDTPVPNFNVVPGELGTANTTAVDYTGNYNLSQYGTGGPITGTAYYGSSAAYAGVGGLPAGSSVALIPTGDVGYYTSAINAGTANFGFQTYVRPNNTTGIQVIASNGGVSNGWNLFTANGTDVGFSAGYRYFAEVVGLGILDSGITVDAGGAVHNIAYVNDNGSNLFYYDFTQVASANFGGITAAGANFSLGFRASNVDLYYTGTIDEARLFTFAEGGFSASDLQNYVVPEPSTFAMLLVGGIGSFVAFRRRARF